MNIEHMQLQPRISEKAYATSASGVYIFDVPTSATKVEIKKAVQAQFKVTVTKVRTVVQNGKKVSSNRRRNRPVDGYRAKTKKAYVTLTKGDKLDFFEEVEG